MIGLVTAGQGLNEGEVASGSSTASSLPDIVLTSVPVLPLLAGKQHKRAKEMVF